MSEFDLHIERHANGYTIRARDPAIVKSNEKRDYSSKHPTPYRSPEKKFVFKDVAEVLVWLKKNLNKALPADEFDSSFAAAVAEDAK